MSGIAECFTANSLQPEECLGVYYNMKEIDQSRTEQPNQTRVRLGMLVVSLVDKRIDLTKIDMGVMPPWHGLASGWGWGTIKEAIDLVDHVLFNTWDQIQKSDDEPLKIVVEQERGRLRDFFNTPLDDR